MSKKFIILLIVILIPLTLGFFTGYKVGHHPSSTANEPNSNTTSSESAIYQSSNRDSVNDQVSGQRRTAITRAVAMASPAVVGINVTAIQEYRYQNPFSQFFGSDPFFRQYFGDRVYRQEVKSLGSGFIISPDGYILTNDHVAGNAKEITVTLTNKEKYKAKVIGTDPLSDICLLKIDGRDFPFLKLGNSDDILIGEWVIAIGNPFGLFEISDKPTVTVGVVSATGMNLSAEEGRYYHGMIQTDAAINAGNSGGPLLNSLGEVIAMNTLIYTPNQGSIGLGFGIPANRIKNVLNELKKNGKIEHDLWTGIDVQTVDMRVARYFGLDKAEGVIVSDVKSGSPADRAGMKVGDIILEVNGERVANEETLISLLTDSKPGDVWKMNIVRDKKPAVIQMKLERSSS